MRALPRVVIEPIVRAALIEDLGRAGDLTTDSIIAADAVATVALVAREPGVVAGLPLAALAWELVDPRISCEVHLPDGSRVEPGSVIATISGPARGLLTGERVALNFLGHLSGVATGTATIADAIAQQIEADHRQQTDHQHRPDVGDEVEQAGDAALGALHDLSKRLLEHLQHPFRRRSIVTPSPARGQLEECRRQLFGRPAHPRRPSGPDPAVRQKLWHRG